MRQIRVIVIIFFLLFFVSSLSEGLQTNVIYQYPDPDNYLSKSNKYVNFNFDQVDVRFLVKLVGEITGKKFVIDKPVEGKITVVTPPKISVDELYPLFLTILEAAGCTVVERDGIHHVVQKERRIAPVAPVVGPDQKLKQDGIVTKVFRLKNIPVGDVKRLVDPMIDQGKAGAVGVLEHANYLIVTDTAESIRRIEALLNELDTPGSTRITEVVRLKYASAIDTANELNQAMAGAASRADTTAERLRQRLPAVEGRSSGVLGTTLPTEVVVVAAPHANSLLMVGSASQIAELKRIIALMDVEPYAGSGNLRAIPLKYLAAEDAAKSLTALISKGAEKPQQQKISIEPNTANNSLLIYASPQDFEMVRKLVEQIDEPPQQVLIEVIFAEMTLSEGRDLGSTLVAAGSPESGQRIAIGAMQTGEGNSELISTVMQGIAPEGLTFGIAKGSYVDSSGKVVSSFPLLANIKAIDKASNFKILSSIPLWAQNNQSASVTVGKNIPILKSTIAGGTGSSRDIIENIDRIDVGIKLSVTPHINPNGEVLMKLNPSIEAILESSSGGKAFTPTIAKREVSTTMTVPDGDTIVISGLIREDVVKKERKIPFLGSIPLIGWLFKSKTDAIERTNLLIFVTPRVMKNAKDAVSTTDRIREKTQFDSSVTNISLSNTNDLFNK